MKPAREIAEPAALIPEPSSPLNRAVDTWLSIAADTRQIDVLDLTPDELGRKQSVIVGLSCLLMVSECARF